MEAKSQATSSQSNQSLPANGAVADNGTSKIRADFEGLLELAESLERSLEHHSDAYSRSHLKFQVLALLTYVELFIGFLVGTYHTGLGIAVFHNMRLFGADPIVLGLFVPSIVLTLHHTYQAWRYSIDMKYAGRADKRGLTEIVELLREIEPVVAREEDWSVLERLQIRIRLSRFGIGASRRDDEGIVLEASPEGFHARKSRVDQEIMKPLR